MISVPKKKDFKIRDFSGKVNVAMDYQRQWENILGTHDRECRK